MDLDMQWTLYDTHLISASHYGTDKETQLLIVIQSITQMAVTQEFGNPNPRIKGISLASQIGMLVGAAAWGLSADVVGRKFAFNSSLFMIASFVLIAGGMPSYLSYASMYVLRPSLRSTKLMNHTGSQSIQPPLVEDTSSMLPTSTSSYLASGNEW